MTRHPLLPLSFLAALLIGTLHLGGCASQPTPSEPPAPPLPDTMMLVKQGSRFTYLEEIYRSRQRENDQTRTITWLASTAGIDSAHTDSTLWKARIVDDSTERRTVDDAVPMTILYRRNGDVVMQRFFESYVDKGFVDMVIPLSVHADIELPYHYSIQQYGDHHQYTYSSFTRTTTCRYLGRDTIDRGRRADGMRAWGGGDHDLWSQRAEQLPDPLPQQRILRYLRDRVLVRAEDRVRRQGEGLLDRRAEQRRELELGRAHASVL
jgi:hypothetical protein